MVDDFVTISGYFKIKCVLQRGCRSGPCFYKGIGTSGMKVKKGQIVELIIDKLAFGGQGIGFLNGLVVFVKNTAPGDKIRARVFKRKRDYCEAKLIELLDPSPARIAPPCPYSGCCGGCQWQHISYDKQLEFKGDLVSEAMRKIGGLEVDIMPILPSEKVLGYRNKMEFSFSDKAWVPNPEDISKFDQGFALGLHVPGTYYKVLDIHKCLLQPEEGNLLLNEVRAFANDSGLPCYNLKTHEGFWRFLAIRHSEATGQWMINIVTSEEKRNLLQVFSQQILEKYKNIGTIINNITRRQAGVAVGEKEYIIHGPGYLIDKIGPYRFRVSANSFFQTNTHGARKLYDVVDEFCDLKGGEVVLDLYSGTGTIPIYLAKKCKKVIGIEIVASAVSDAQKNCELNNIGNATFFLGDIKDNLPLIKDKPDIVILDPPRAGVHKKVIKHLLELYPEKIIYVSCNPSTMARDLKQLLEGYELHRLQPVDMFPNTYHVETVAKLEKRKKC